MTTIFKKFATGTAALALMTTVFAGSTLAADNDVTTQINGKENVDITTISATSFGEAILLDGTTQTLKGAAIDTFNVVDARGTGTGWNVAVTASPFKHESNEKSLSANSLTLAAPTVELIDKNSSAAITVSPQGGTIDGASVKILSAGLEGGMGGYTISPMLMELELKPKEVYAGKYTSTVTVALTTGP